MRASRAPPARLLAARSAAAATDTGVACSTKGHSTEICITSGLCIPHVDMYHVGIYQHTECLGMLTRPAMLTPAPKRTVVRL